MKPFAAISWSALRPLGTALFVLVLVNIGLYSVLPQTQATSQADRPRSLYFDFDAPTGTGWYRAETSGDGTTFQWMSNDEAALQFTISARDTLEVVFRVVNGLPDMTDALQLTVNGLLIPLDHSGDRFSGVIPQEILTTQPNNLNLVFRVPSVSRPSDLDPNSTDTRTLGAAFDWLIVRPLADHTTLYEFDQGCTRDHGWYVSEVDGSDGSTFCWSSATDATLSIRVPRGKAFTLEAGIVEAITPDALASFRLEIDGSPLTAQPESHAGRMIYTAAVPPLDADSALVTFHVDQVGTPPQPSSDQRALGVRVDWLRVTEKP